MGMRSSWCTLTVNFPLYCEGRHLCFPRNQNRHHRSFRNSKMRLLKAIAESSDPICQPTCGRYEQHSRALSFCYLSLALAISGSKDIPWKSSRLGSCPEQRSVLNGTSRGPATSCPTNINKVCGPWLSLQFQFLERFWPIQCQWDKICPVWKKHFPLLEVGFLVRNNLYSVGHWRSTFWERSALYLPLKSKVSKHQRRRFYIAGPVCQLASPSCYRVRLNKSPVKRYRIVYKLSQGPRLTKI